VVRPDLGREADVPGRTLRWLFEYAGPWPDSF
jgi:hypothetical protein